MTSLVQAVFQGGGTPAASLVPPALWGYDAALKPYTYDPAAAKKMLAEAGYPNGFRVDLWAIPVVRAYMPNGRRAAEMIQADWAKIGVTANIITYEWGEYLKPLPRRRAERRDDRRHLGLSRPDRDAAWFTCDNPGGNNVSHWCNQDYRSGRRRPNVVTDQAERAQLYTRGQEVYDDDDAGAVLADVKAYVRGARTTSRDSSCTSSAASRSAASRSANRRYAMQLALSTWQEVEDYLRTRDGIIVPIGSTEQHGPNGLIGTDHLGAEFVAKGVGDKIGWLVAPTSTIGMSQHHLGFPGSVTLRPRR